MKRDAHSFILVFWRTQAHDLDKKTDRETTNKAKQYDAFHMRHSKFVRMMFMFINVMA